MNKSIPDGVVREVHDGDNGIEEGGQGADHLWHKEHVLDRIQPTNEAAGIVPQLSQEPHEGDPDKNKGETPTNANVAAKSPTNHS